MNKFELDHRLQSDCALVGELSLCQVLLLKDANYPWVILVPKRANISEVFELEALDQEQLAWESSFVAENMKKHFSADKMNIAALGNMVPQLHIHHVCRQKSDPAWPNPVWGRVPAKSYTPDQLQQRIKELQSCLATSVFIPES